MYSIINGPDQPAESKSPQKQAGCMSALAGLLILGVLMTAGFYALQAFNRASMARSIPDRQATPEAQACAAVKEAILDSSQYAPGPTATFGQCSAIPDKAGDYVVLIELPEITKSLIYSAAVEFDHATGKIRSVTNLIQLHN